MNTSTITVRIDGTKQTAQVTTTVDEPLRNTFAYSPVPAARAVNPGSSNANVAFAATSAQKTAELVRQVARAQPIINGSQRPNPIWSSRRVVVPNGQPLIPVTCGDTTNHQAEIGAAGLPIPPDIYIPPSPDSDKALLIWQPGAPNGGFLWEIQGGSWATPGVRLNCTHLARIANANGRNQGHFVDYVGGPGGSTPAATYSTWEAKAWGITGAGAMYTWQLLTRKDFLRGYADHAIGLEVYNANSGAHPWPCVRTDGTDASNVLAEGDFGFLPASTVIDPTWPLADQVVVRTMVKSGFYITDKTLFGIAVRCATDAADLVDDAHLTKVPWSAVQFGTPGSDTTWHPLA